MLRFLTLLLALIGIIGYVLWLAQKRIRRRAEKVQVKPSPSAARASVRGYFSGRSQKNERAIAIVSDVDDARVLAALAFVAIAQSDGEINGEERSVIVQGITSRMALSAVDAAALLDHSRQLADGVTNLDRYLSTVAVRLAPLADADQRRDVTELAVNILNANGPPAEIERRAVERFIQTLAATEA